MVTKWTILSIESHKTYKRMSKMIFNGKCFKRMKNYNEHKKCFELKLGGLKTEQQTRICISKKKGKREMKTTKSLTIVGGNKNSYLTEYKKESWKSIFTQKVEVSHMHIFHCCIFYAQRLQPLCSSFTLLIHQQLVCYYEINFAVRCLDTNKNIFE